MSFSIHFGSVRRRLAATGLLFALAATSVWAAGFGSLSGRVTDRSGQAALFGARITVIGTGLQTYTNSTGNYVLSDVPEGTQTVEVGYVGYDPLSQPVTIAGPTRADFAFNNDVVKLEKFVITGAAVGTARAINEQRAADTLTNIVAADGIGRFPDQNAAEALARVPGLALYRDQGEGRFVVIRGINSQYNGVSINGFRAATSEKGTRTVPLDNVAAQSIAALEVNKVATPDKDADGLGGSVNVRTRTAFDYNDRFAQLDGAWVYSKQEGRSGEKLSGLWSDRYAGGKLGVLVGASYDYHPYSSFNNEGDSQWTQVTSPTDGQQHWRFNEADYRHYEPTRSRVSGNASIDFQPDSTLHIYLRGIATLFDDKEHRWMTSIPFSAGTLTALTDTSGSVNNVTGVLLRDRERDEAHRIASSVLGWEKTAGPWKFEGGVSYNEGNESRRAAELYYTTIGKANFSYTFPTYFNVITTQTGGTSISDPTNYKLSSKTQYTAQHGGEDVGAVHQDARYEFDLGDRIPGYVKVGVSYAHKHKDEDYNTWTVSAIPFTVAESLIPSDPRYPLFSGLRINSAYTNQLFKSLSGFTTTRALSKDIPADFDATEDVTAGYAMAGLTVQKLKVLAGFRVESTSFKMNGQQLLNGITVSPVSAGRDYSNFLPGVHLTYEVTKQLLLRASWSNTLSRPPFENTQIGRVVDDSKKTVAQGNPALKELNAENWDGSAEYYLPSLGLVSASAFYKGIKNFTYQSSTGIDAATGYTLTSYLNGPHAHITGVEFGWQQQFRKLPAPFDGLGLMANVTFSTSAATYPTRPGEKLPFIGQSDTIGNAAVTYEKEGWYFQVSLNHHTPRLRVDEAIGTTAQLDPHEDRFTEVDASASYRFKQNWELYLNFTNLTNAPFKTYFASSPTKRLEQYEYYDMTAVTGLRWHF